MQKSIYVVTSCLALLSMMSLGTNCLAYEQWSNASNGDFNTASNWQETELAGQQPSPFPFFVPGPGDLAAHDAVDNTGVLGVIQINSDAGRTATDSFRGALTGVDSLRLSYGGSVNHTAGSLQVINNFTEDFGGSFSTDIGFWVGEFGTRTFAGASSAPSVYTLSGGSVVIEDPGDTFQIGRNWDVGTQSDYSDGQFVMTGGSVDATAGGAIIGLDGFALFDQSAGTFSAGDIDIGKFASPLSEVNLSGTASWSTGSIILADQQNKPEFRLGRTEGAGETMFNVSGSNVSVTAASGLFVRGRANMNFVADSSGVSPVNVTGGLVELSDLFVPGDRPGLSVDLSSYGGNTADPIFLINSTQNVFGQFDGLPEGATISTAIGDRRLTYNYLPSQGASETFDVALVDPGAYVAPPAPPAPVPAQIGRWSMDDVQGPTGTHPHGNHAVLDLRTGLNEGTKTGNPIFLPTPMQNPEFASQPTQDHLFFFGADLGQEYPTSSNTPPNSMFINGNTSGNSSYDASQVLDTHSEGALFFPQDVYGNEFSFEGTFSIEAFFNTGDNTNAQTIIAQGEGFDRYAVGLNDQGDIEFFVNDGENPIEIATLTGDYGDGEWHYLLATFEEGAGANGTGQMTIAVADEDGTTNTTSFDTSSTFLGLPPAFNDGNFLIGAFDFDGVGFDIETGILGPVDPLRFHGQIDEVQISRGLVPESERLGFLDLPGVPGDADGDGDVDGQDFLLLQRTNPSLISVWQQNYGTGSLASATSAVPEPASAASLLLGLASAWLSWRRR